MGKKCYVPRYFKGSNRMDMVLLRDLADLESLPMTSWNIKQPAEDDESRTKAIDCGLDLILVPGLAFTAGGKRLGRGRGYYDTYLRKWKQEKGKVPRTIALAFNEQLLESVPADDNDFVIDRVIAAGVK